MSKLLASFKYALSGIVLAWREEMNFKIEVFMAILAIILGFVLEISRLEWAIILLTIFIVLSVETLNTALEELCDKLEPEHDPHVGKIKDLAAAAVLITSVGAFLVGLLVFLPYLS